MPGCEFTAHEIARSFARKLKQANKSKRLGKDIVVIDVGGYSLRADQIAKRVAVEKEMGVLLGLTQVGTADGFKYERPVFAANLRNRDLKIVSLSSDHPIFIRRWFYDFNKFEQGEQNV